MNEVEAVKGKDEIAMISHLLKKHGSVDFQDIWNLGINTALRITDLLAITIADVKGKEVLELVEGKTGKKRSIKLNVKAQAVIASRIEANPDDVWLFQSKGNRGKTAAKPYARGSVSRKFQEVGAIVGIQLSTHSMRKTRGYMMWADGVPVEVIAKVLNHSSTGITLRYIGIEKADIHATYDDYVL